MSDADTGVMPENRDGCKPSTWPTTPSGEQAVMVCPQCEGEGGYPDGLDEAACHTRCTRCAGNGWIVDLAALVTTRSGAERAWHPRIGEEVRTTESVHERFGEWRGIRLWVAEVRAERGRGERLNITVTEEWPMTKAASLTDAFYVGGNVLDDLAPTLATTPSPDATNGL